MPTLDEYRQALQKAQAAGNYTAVRTLAKTIAEMESDTPETGFSEGARKRTAVEGSLADRERMQAPPPQREPRQLGTPMDFVSNIPRGAMDLPAAAGALVNAAIPENVRKSSRFLGPVDEMLDAVTPESFEQYGDALGLPPRNNTVMGGAGSFVGGGALGGAPNMVRAGANAGLRGLAGSTGRNVGGSLASFGGMEAGGNLAERAGLPPILGQVPGALAPQALASTVGRLSGASQSARAANSQAGKQAVNEAQALGLFPDNPKWFANQTSALSAGIASPNTKVKFVERIFASVPGGMRVMHDFARRLNSGLNDTLKRATGNRVDVRDAGIHLSDGIKSRVARITDNSSKRYAAANRLIPETQPIQFNQLSDEVNNLLGQSPEKAQEVISAIRSGRQSIIPELDEALNKLVNSGGPIAVNSQGTAIRTMTYKEADAIRRAIGQELNSSNLLAAHPQEAELKALYKALSGDVSSSLSGRQKVMYDFARNNWKKDRAVIDQILTPTMGGADNIRFEQIFDRAFAKGGQSTSVLREVYKGLSPQQREVVSKTFIARMGKLSDEAIASAGEIPLNPNFKMDTFITKWRDLPEQSKNIIFAGQPEFRKNMDTFVNYVNRVLETNKAFANPSQSGPVGLAAATGFFALAGISTGATAGLLFGDEGWRDAVKGGVTGAVGAVLTAKGLQAGSRLMTNPGFVGWLARGTRVPVNKTMEHFGRLATLATNNPEAAEDIAVFMQEIENQTDIRQLHGPRVEQGVQ